MLVEQTDPYGKTQLVEYWDPVDFTLRFGDKVCLDEEHLEFQEFLDYADLADDGDIIAFGGFILEIISKTLLVDINVFSDFVPDPEVERKWKERLVAGREEHRRARAFLTGTVDLGSGFGRSLGPDRPAPIPEKNTLGSFFENARVVPRKGRRKNKH